MGIAFVIAAFAGAVGLGFAALTWSTKTAVDPLDPEPQKHWLVEKVSDRPKLARFVEERLDRKTAGGLLLTAGVVGLVLIVGVVGSIFDSLDENSGFAEFDEAVAEFGAANQDTFTSELAEIVTHLGGTPIIIAVTTVVAIWGWWRYKSFQVALFMITVAVGQALINNGLKALVERDRPDFAQLAPWSGSSFPSGHSAAAAATYSAAAYVLTLRGSRAQKAIAVGIGLSIAAAVAATRAILGVHWLTDVIAGVAVGYGWFVVCAVAFGGKFMSLGEPVEEVKA